MSFDKKLKALRLENKMTQEYVASRLNVAHSTIAGYETKNRQPSHEKLASIASLFHVTIDYLLDETDSIELNPSQGVIYSDTEKNLVLRYRKLSAQSRKELLSYIDLLELRDSQNG
ncbi:HTH-type transcriptional regulator Xre [Lachnospiraceae bacterium]|nr:HTH-type transcriptional regulator Xre [Lachnospiraceae bacterium]